jgi:uncharacterized membrane protein
MPPAVSEWSNLILRWTHVFVAILWIGQTYYFTKLDLRLSREEDAAKASGKPAQVWMVHSGGFYIVERQRTPQLLPQKLHWFRWEAAATWLSGFCLLGLLYYSDGLLLDDSVSKIGMGTGIAIGIGTLFLGWALYDMLWMSPLGRSPLAGGIVCYLLVVALAYGLTHVLSGRAAYIHVGSLFGTIMAANVWMRILPAQKKMLAALAAGKPPDMTLAARAKARSKHNTFMALPVIFLMISSHFAASTYGQSYNWLILSALVLVGAIAGKIIYSI